MVKTLSIRREIFIFIGSSINDFQLERHELTGYIYTISDWFETHYGVRVRPLLCEYLDPAMRPGGKQEDINDLIRKSDMSCFLFFRHAGKYSVGEFDLAYDLLCKSGKPKIYVYFKNIPESDADDSLRAVKEKVKNALGHYHGTFDSIDTIKLRILENLKFQEFIDLPVEIKNGKIYAGGVPVLDICNVAEFANNETLAGLRRRLKETEERYFPMKAQYETRRSDPVFYRAYSEIAEARQDLSDRIEELEKQIFDLSLNMVRDTVRGDITLRQKEAYRLFEQGDLRGANAILNADEIENEFLRLEREKTRELQEGARRYIREIRTKIEVLSAMTDNAERFAEIKALYEKIIPYAEQYRTEADVLFDYAVFLHTQNDHNGALSAAVRLQKLHKAHPGLAGEFSRAALRNLLGSICTNLHDYAKAEEHYLEALAVYEQLAAENPAAHDPDLAMSCNSIGILYRHLHNYKKAEKYYFKAISIRERLAAENPAAYNPDLAMSCNSIGNLYANLHDLAKAEKYHLKAVSIRERLAAENPAAYEPDLAMSCNNIGALYANLHDFTKAEEYYLEALSIYERLAAENPAAYEPNRATSCNNIGAFYSDLHDYAKAKEYYLKALSIRERLAAENPAAYESYWAKSCNSIGILYHDLHNYKKAEEYHLKALAVYERLAAENPAAYEPDLAGSHNNIGTLYADLLDYAKAEEYYLKALSAYERLAAENPAAYEPNLAKSCNNIGVLYRHLNNYKKAEKYYFKAIFIRERLAAENPAAYEPVLAGNCYNIGNLYSDLRNYKNAEKYYLKAAAIYERLYADLPKAYIDDLIDVCEALEEVYTTLEDRGAAEAYRERSEALKLKKQTF